MCLEKKVDQKYERRFEEKDVVKILQNMSETGQINYVNLCLNNISKEKKKLKNLFRKFFCLLLSSCITNYNYRTEDR